MQNPEHKSGSHNLIAHFHHCSVTKLIQNGQEIRRVVPCRYNRRQVPCLFLDLRDDEKQV